MSKQPSIRLHVPPISVDVKTDNSDGHAYGDTLTVRHVDGNNTDLARILRDMAHHFGGTTDNTM